MKTLYIGLEKQNFCPIQYLLEFFKQVIFEVLHLQLISVKSKQSELSLKK